MQIWVTIGAPMPGMLMPRDFIIAKASGGRSRIWGMSGMSMVVEIFHNPALPRAAKAAAGASTIAATTKPETSLLFMTLPQISFAANLTGRQALSIAALVTGWEL
jgi:hypothetical protein